MPTGIRIKPGEPQGEVIQAHSLDDLQALVGGYIERVNMGSNDHKLTVYANEEGLMRGLGYNVAASTMQQLGFPPEARRTMGLVGDVIFFGPDDGHGNETDLTMEQLREVFKID